MLHVVCVTNRITDLITGELSWQTLVLAASKFIKSRQADLRFGYASEKHECGTMSREGLWWGRQSTDEAQEVEEKAREKLGIVSVPKSLWRAGVMHAHEVGYQVENYTQNA